MYPRVAQKEGVAVCPLEGEMIAQKGNPPKHVTGNAFCRKPSGDG
jgi:hypothetical protein